MKNIFRRISDILTANVNSIIDQAENPEKLIQQLIREMEENICYAKREAVKAIASEKKLEKQLISNHTEVDKWMKRAEFSVNTEDEKMARLALLRKKELETISSDLTNSLCAATQITKKLKFQIKEMCSKLAEAKRKSVTLSVRQRAAEVRSTISTSVDNIKSMHDIQFEFSRMESKVIDMESMTEAMIEIDDENDSLSMQYEKMEIDLSIEKELAELKQKSASNLNI